MGAAHQEMAYAVHTNTCTYLLDEDGVCRWIVSQLGVVPAHVRQCIGAQFVACLDLRTEGGLVGELRPGARALFVRSGEDRMVLLRTGLIQHIDDRRTVQEQQLAERQDQTQGQRQDQTQGQAARATAPQPLATRVGHGFAMPDPASYEQRQYGKSGGLPYRAKPPRFGVVRRSGEEQTITVNKRPAASAPHHPDTAYPDPDYPADAQTIRRRQKD